ncbi:MAG: hypothetical protein ACI89D_002042 [Bermanella sp.]|jgi:hypothetical protein
MDAQPVLKIAETTTIDEIILFIFMMASDLRYLMLRAVSALVFGVALPAVLSCS